MKLLPILLLLGSFAYADTKDIFLVISKDDRESATAFSVKTNKGAVYTLTNAHVCDHQKILIIINDEAEQHIAIVKRVSKLADLCLLTPVSKTGYSLSNDYKFGETVVVTGYPHDKHTVSSGPLGKYLFMSEEAVKNSKYHGDTYLMYHGKADFGSSGSPALNSKGEVVGVLALVYDGTMAALVPLEFVKDFLEQF